MMPDQPPRPVLTFPRPLWRTVKCPNCGKTFCEAQAGSTLRWRCRKCTRDVVCEIARDAA